MDRTAGDNPPGLSPAQRDDAARLLAAQLSAAYAAAGLSGAERAADLVRRRAHLMAAALTPPADTG
jgi:hypothetical protein